jgi:hypothetical protein
MNHNVGGDAQNEEGNMADQPKIQESAEPDPEEVREELEKKPGDTLEPTVAGAEAANERLRETIEQSSPMGGKDDALGMETKIIEKIAGND